MADTHASTASALPRSAAPTQSLSLLRHLVVPLGIILLAPPFMMVTWYAHVHLDGSLLALARWIGEEGFFTVVFGNIWGPVFLGSPTAWAILGGYAAVQALFMRLLPGQRYEGPPTRSGHVPVYKQNGLLAFGLTMALFVGLSWGLGWFSPSVLYHRFGELLGALNLFSLLFCGALYLKGRLAPSPGEHNRSGNPLFDYYWGIELYPRVWGLDIKMLTNCRLAMMGWPLLIVSYAAAQHELHGITDGMVVAVALQLIYIAKFFWWEPGYMRSLDIMHDRAGFYIVWGVLVWLPMVYTGGTFYLVANPLQLGWPLSIGLFVLGVAGIFINYFADEQRQRVRATGGKTKVWGKEPEIIIGHYTTEDGEARQSLLLANGWWGIARHFHYVPELTAAFCWTAVVGFRALLPWFYFIFLVILLFDRSVRDDKRCAEKYGADWELYRKKVPYRIIPGVF